MKKVLLYSGGMDSWLISKLANPDVLLFFDLGTPSSDAELARIRKNGDNVVVDETLKGLGQLERQGDFIVPLRNLFLIARAAEYGEHIILGTNKTDCHNDKTEEFALRVEDLLNYYYGPSQDGLSQIKDITVDFSYKEYDRVELCRLFLERGGNVEEALQKSFSCYTPDGDGECHNCRPCFRKMMGFFVAGAEFPKGYLHSFIPYLENKLNSTEQPIDRYYTRKQYQDVLARAREDI